MRIELSGLESGKGAFAHAYAPGELVLDEERLRLKVAPTLSGKIHQQGRRVIVSGVLAARVLAECGRCLIAVEIPVDSAFRVEYVTPEDYEAQQADELAADDLNLSVFNGEAIDIDDLVTEELLLAVPDHILCKESCKGMCATCGADRNATECGCETRQVDPRWAGLKELVSGE